MKIRIEYTVDTAGSYVIDYDPSVDSLEELLKLEKVLIQEQFPGQNVELRISYKDILY